MHIPELLAPAGTPEALAAAFACGADAAYLGLKDFNARMRGGNFSYAQLEGAIDGANRLGKRIYVAFNTLITEDELDKAYAMLRYLSGVNPHGVIVQDYGVMRLIRDNFPDLPLHVSTQAAVAGSSSVHFYEKLGAKRVVLARELSLEEIAKVKASTNMELEVFCHGALCVAYSGLCLFTSYLGGASANRGRCAQACRRSYQAGSSTGNFFSPKDLQSIEILPELAAAGVDSLKIEGRMKSPGYVAGVVRAYRLVLDNLDKPETVMQRAKSLLAGDMGRSKTLFFMKTLENADFLTGTGGATGIALGALSKTPDGLFLKSDFELKEGDFIRVQRADDTFRGAVKYREITSAPDGYLLSLEGALPGDFAYLAARKEEKFPDVVPENLAAFTKKPSPISLPSVPVSDISGFPLPEGRFVLISTVADAFPFGTIKPAMLWIELNKNVFKTIKAAQKPLPVKKERTAFYLDPFFPQDREGALAAEIECLTEMGYRRFVINSVGQLEIFRKLALPDVAPVAGPWLYFFNRFALSLLASQEFQSFVFPFEGQIDNMIKCVQKFDKSRFILPVFGRPELFQMRLNLKKIYNFDAFTDRDGAAFTVESNKSGSKVFPATPFSVVERERELQNQGVSRFLYDFRHGSSAKEIELVFGREHRYPLKFAGDFNLERGFYNKEE